MAETNVSRKVLYVAYLSHASRWWSVRVPDLRGVHTQGRTWNEAIEMTRDAIASVLNVDPNSFEVAPRLVDSDVQEGVDQFNAARKAAAVAREAEAKTLQAAALKLTSSGINVRDAGAILGISYQRVSQLTSDARSG